MQSRAATVEEYLAELPEDRREAVGVIRGVVLENLGEGFEEGMQYGMIGYFVPHRVYPKGYHCDPTQPLPFMSLASQKNHIGLYLGCVYVDAGEQERFVKAWKASGKRLDMGKSCVRVKNLDGVPLDVLGALVGGYTAEKYVGAYEASLAAPRPARKKAGTKGAVKKGGGKKTVAKKAGAKKATSEKVVQTTAKKGGPKRARR